MCEKRAESTCKIDEEVIEMVISTYQGKDSLWYSASIHGVDVALIKIDKGPWLRVKDLSDGKYEVREIPHAEHGKVPVLSGKHDGDL